MTKEIGVGLIGVGTVGGGVARALLERRAYFASQVGAELVLRRAAVRDLTKPRTVDLPAGILTTDVDAVIRAPDIDVVVELTGVDEPAGAFIRTALAAGKHVVTANKELIAKSGPELIALSRAARRDIMFEATVGGGIPLIAPLRRDLLANRISSVRAIINGTTNYILTKMAQEGTSYADALAGAQALGYAEPDPTNDVEGIDAAYKLAIMASLAFRVPVRPHHVHAEGISKLAAADLRYAAELGYVIKLLAIAERIDGGIVTRVSPALLPQAEPLARVDGVFNAVQITGDLTGMVLLQGRGAGAEPTSSAVVADILDLAHSIVHAGSERESWRYPAPEDASSVAILGLDALMTRFYLRVTVKDQPGVLARIAQALGDAGVSIAAVNQKEADETAGTAELVVMTHRAREGAMRAALATIEALPVVARIESFLRVEA
ncbi:MAG: homoserine dehydrogenase [Dehalococcoidia bacterium]